MLIQEVTDTVQRFTSLLPPLGTAVLPDLPVCLFCPDPDRVQQEPDWSRRAGRTDSRRSDPSRCSRLKHHIHTPSDLKLPEKWWQISVLVKRSWPPWNMARLHSSSQLDPAASRASYAIMGASWPLRPGQPSELQRLYIWTHTRTRTCEPTRVSRSWDMSSCEGPKHWSNYIMRWKS